MKDYLWYNRFSSVDGSPRRGEPSIAEIEILANDNANGVLQLSTDSVVVSEDYVGPVINVTRTAGAFGTVTVKFQTIPGSALANVDYSVTSTDVILYGGETSKQLPIEIINDRIPERNETFLVRLLDQITGGAILGTPQEAEIMIESSDDPNGNFGFGTSSQTVTEPSDGQERQLTINLVRNSGVLGVVAVQWEARLNGM
ncbi:putative G-protein coupled receptor [Apostichopus japonicus]|uniref:Putative G-protein coupled receptor n=1 Tax=Stichopus japonicus TaxID=307972 RepID=A0A2G8JEJ5_STIJA|nr:putative G-protein coupled receptor [Apostichopus japonicus]